jgi:hypothetical protein
MEEQPRYEPLEASRFFPDGMASRPLVEGTVARGHLRADDHFYRGRVNGELAREFPFEVTREVLLRGQERFNIFCSHCHDRAGTGRGMVVQAGFPRPPDFHEGEHAERLRRAPPGHLFDVITNGLGRMPDHAEQIPPRDRWAIAAYVRALQFSQYAHVDELPEEDREILERIPRTPEEDERDGD